MQIIPLQPVPNQTLKVILNKQLCQINVYEKFFGLYVDLYINNVTLIIGGVVAENLNRIVRSKYLGFVGDLCFFDTQGTDDPISSGLGSQFVLCYLEPSDPVPAVPGAA